MCFFKYFWPLKACVPIHPLPNAVGSAFYKSIRVRLNQEGYIGLPTGNIYKLQNNFNLIIIKYVAFLQTDLGYELFYYKQTLFSNYVAPTLKTTCILIYPSPLLGYFRYWKHTYFFNSYKVEQKSLKLEHDF